MYGPRLGIGRNFHLGNRFFLGPRLEGYFYGALKGTKQKDETNNSQALGGEAVLKFSRMFDFITKDAFFRERGHFHFELFVEAGYGLGSSVNRKTYKKQSGSIDDYYQAQFEDQYYTTSLNAGVKLISKGTGFFLYLKGGQTNWHIKDRELRLKNTSSSALEISNLGKDSFTSTIWSLGAGRYF